jgi:hypothetical protein
MAIYATARSDSVSVHFRLRRAGNRQSAAIGPVVAFDVVLELACVWDRSGLQQLLMCPLYLLIYAYCRHENHSGHSLLQWVNRHFPVSLLKYEQAWSLLGREETPLQWI